MGAACHPRSGRVTYPPRRVNNIYFDTARYDGLKRRTQQRRRAGEIAAALVWSRSARIVDGQLERKRKQGMIGWKEIVPVAGEFDLTGRRGAPDTRLRTTTASVVLQWLDVLAVYVLINHYHRAYYATPDEAVRLTIDSALCAYDQRASPARI